MIVKLLGLIVGIAILRYFLTGSGQTGRAQEDDRIPLMRPIGTLIGCVLGISSALLVAKDCLGSMKYVSELFDIGLGTLRTILAAYGIGGQ